MKKKVESEAPVQAESEQTIEEIFGNLDGIIEKLEDGSISLEESFKYYEAGMKLVKNCSEKIDKVEKQIIVLNEGNA